MRRFTVVLVMLLGVSLLAACSSGTNETKKSSNDRSGMDMSSDDMGSMHDGNSSMSRPVVPGAREIVVKGEGLAFDPKTITVKADEDVTIVFTAVDAEHDFYVKDIGHVVHAKMGETAKGGLAIDKPGTYAFWCTVTGHREGGMTGQIVVT